ncbi:MAG: DUF1427 family protein [Luteimonas sp.]|nr:DUF1427 family protein [Luteimonas sp.]
MGLALGLVIGALCRLLAIPSPAPTMFAGALLVVAMTLGYIAADRWLARRHALHEPFCGDPDDRIKSATRTERPIEKRGEGG